MFRSPGISCVVGIATTVILIAQPCGAPPAPAASAAGRALPGDPCGTVHGSAFVLLRASNAALRRVRLDRLRLVCRRICGLDTIQSGSSDTDRGVGARLQVIW